MFRCAILIILVISSCRLRLSGSPGVKAHPILASESQAPSLVSQETQLDVNGIPVPRGLVKWRFQCLSKSGCRGPVDELELTFFMIKKPESLDVVFEVSEGGFLDSEGKLFRALAYVHGHDTKLKDRVEKQRTLLGKVGQLLAHGKITPPGRKALQCTIIKDARFMTYPDSDHETQYRASILPIIADNLRAKIHTDMVFLKECEATMIDTYNRLLLPALRSFMKKYRVIPLPDRTHVVFPMWLEHSGPNDVVFQFDQEYWRSISNYEHEDDRVKHAIILAHEQFFIDAKKRCKWLQGMIRDNPKWPNAPDST